MWSQFESIDKDKDGRLNVEEFKVGCATVGLDLPAAEAEAEFKKCDADGGGVILFAEFCTWCCHRSVGTDPLAKEAAEDSLRASCAEQIREYLLRKEKGDHTEGVVKAFKKADYEPLTWIDELEQLGKEGLLDQFLESCKKKEKREAVAKGGGKAKKATGGKKSAPVPKLTMPNKEARTALFREIDVNGNGGLSLAEIDKAVVGGQIGRAMNCPDFDHKPALMRAYKAADTSGDEFIERSEFFKLLKCARVHFCSWSITASLCWPCNVCSQPQILTVKGTARFRYMVYFNNLWHKFEEIDSDHDRRINAEEFASGCSIIGLQLSPEEAAAEFKKCDADGGGQILFGEFCTWCVKRHVATDDDVGEEPPSSAGGSASHAAGHKIGGGKKKAKSKPKQQPAPKLTMPNKEARTALFREIDVNGNGGLSLAEIDKAVVSGQIGRAMNCPDFDHKPALMRAYKAADTSGDEFIERSEFFKLLKCARVHFCSWSITASLCWPCNVCSQPQILTVKGTARFRYMVYFNNLWHKFEEIDSDHDRRINAEEFASGCSIIGLQLSPEEAAAEFKKCDADGGGQILFGEFCTWCAARHIADQEEIEEAEPPARPATAAAPAPATHAKKKKKAKQGGGCCASRPPK